MTGRKLTRQDEAAAWFAASRAGAMLVEKRAEFEAWLEDPRNEAAFDAMQDLWDDLAILKGAVPAKPAPRRLHRGVAAAILGLVLAGGAGATWAGATWLALRDTTSVIQTMAGEQRTQTLPDGSVIAVNVASSVSYAIEADRRLIKLDAGEAAFTVKPDPARPFIVRVGAFDVRAIGTAFNVRLRDGALEVAVSEGRVEICAASGPQTGARLADLSKGQIMRFLEQAEPSTVIMPAPRPIPPGEVSEWRLRIVSYQDATVGEVVADINRYFPDRLLIDQPTLAAERVTIRLQVDDRERAIETLASLLDARLETTARGDVLTR